VTYKATQVYVMMRETWDFEEEAGDVHDYHPVAVFTDLETAEGNSDGYNLTMEEQGIKGIKFYITTTTMYE
jgi:hypothetical protein